MSIHCNNCNSGIDLKEAVIGSPYSWPNRQTFYHICSECQKGNQIRINEGEWATVKVISAPGPEWIYLEREKMKDLSFRIDPAFLHIYIGSEHFDIKER